jgi:hypothetical protein
VPTHKKERYILIIIKACKCVLIVKPIFNSAVS